MNFVLLDLEWNDTYCKKIHGFINEIVEFGAIKLDDNFNEIDSFSVIVRSAASGKLSTRFKELTGMTNLQMLSGVPFRAALYNYKNWVGDDSVTLTWSNSDLFTLYKNCEVFLESPLEASVGKYVDLQKYFQAEEGLKGNPSSNQISLSNAAELLGVPFSKVTLHHALDDSRVAAEILKKCYNKARFEPFVVDTDDVSFYERLMFKAHYIKNIDHPMLKAQDTCVACPICHKDSKRIAPWCLKGIWFNSTFFCKDCNKRFKASVSFKRHFDFVKVKKRYYPSAVKSADGVEKIPASK